jgi:ribose transport system ATP-binding protein
LAFKLSKECDNVSALIAKLNNKTPSSEMNVNNLSGGNQQKSL